MLFERRSRRGRGPGLTPLIDVVFLLLVFFMLASRFDRESSLPLALRVASAEATADAQDLLRVHLDAAGTARVDGMPLDDRALALAVRSAVRDGLPVRIRPAPDARLQSIVDLLGLMRRAGATDVDLERSPLEPGDD